MRAYMSRVSAGHPGGPWGLCAIPLRSEGRWQNGDPVGLALAELQIILAETEPPGGYYDSISYCLLQGSAAVGLAMFEALAAATADGGLFDQLQTGGAK